jgi:hypothetical protein
MNTTSTRPTAKQEGHPAPSPVTYILARRMAPSMPSALND